MAAKIVADACKVVFHRLPIGGMAMPLHTAFMPEEYHKENTNVAKMAQLAQCYE